MTIVHGLLPTDVTNDEAAVHAVADLAVLLSTLGDPTRLAILSHLRGGEHRVGELAQHLGLAQSTVSQHLAVLRAAGLISTHTHGRAHVSTLEHPDELAALLVTAAALHRSTTAAQKTTGTAGTTDTVGAMDAVQEAP
ncbi:ArsR family transcriptional regulator [Actinomyces sp. 2119]|uniref:ArsR family transcriptional regulator n=1 Tax=Actinomyces lilanjuaniae TaxID=2321394 RepID=A0ABM6Z2B9_9ACTO|nr:MULTISPECIES: metalloregulator ArsR/SmtB family transcription factor [Actinomyces]AYD89458.1 ArsR family transcriptional regulator [Actinomyces lilanjuaniae]RJF43185.1 ArsR family transcriptional regulator [Actinomyces sp. 2119]